jgi:hypothetical protein
MQKYDNKFKEVYSKEFESADKNVSTLGVTYFKNKFAWFTSERNGKEDFIRYDVVPITKAGAAEKPKKIAQFPYERKRDIPNVKWTTSQDSSKMAFIAYEDLDKDDENMEFFVSVINSNFEKTWDKKFKLKYAQEVFEPISFTNNSSEDVFVLAKVYEGNKAKESKRDRSKGKKVAAYELKLFQFSKNASEVKEYALNLGGAFLKYGTIKIAPTGDLVSAGFYSGTRGGATQGVFYMILNAATGEIKSAQKKEFSASDLAILGDKNTEKDKGDEGLDDRFEFRDIRFKADGSAHVSAEQNYVVVYTSYNSKGGTTTHYTYYSNDIVVIAINPKGVVEHINLIPKRQRFAMPTYEFFVSLANDKGSAFFYNDDVDNLNKPAGSKTKYISSFKDCVAVMTFIDNNGKATKKALFDRDDTKALFVPSKSSRISDKEIFFIAQKFSLFGGTDFRIGTISID